MRTSAPRCPIHREPLDGGPVQFWCPCRHTVYAADLRTEYRPAVTR